MNKENNIDSTKNLSTKNLSDNKLDIKENVENDKAHKSKVHELIAKYRTLSDLILGILIFCVIAELGLLAGCYFFWGKYIYHSIGLLLGGLIAIFLAMHMYRSICTAVEFDSETATKLMRKGTYIRYLAIIIILAGFMILNVVNPLTVFLGIMGLKAGAYAQPFVHKILDMVVGPEPINDCPLVEDSEDKTEDKTEDKSEDKIIGIN